MTLNRISRITSAIIVTLCLVFFCNFCNLCDVFINKTLHLYFTLSVSTLLLFFLQLFCMVKSKLLILSKTRVVAILWSVYILLHSYLIVSCENYYTFYFLWGMLYYISISYLTKINSFDSENVIAIFAYMGIFQSCVCLLQGVGLIESNNQNFAVTGTFENANITAMYITATLPYFLFQKCSTLNKKNIRNISIFILLIALLLLKCRTAFYGAFFIFLCKALANKKIFNWVKRLSNIKKYSYSMLFVFFMCILALFSYNMKKDSANGRLFIWKVSSEMIIDSPFCGFGYGMFAKEYNIGQANYFKEKITSSVEKQNARYVFMAYNEYIEQWFQGGLLGCLFFFLFYIFSLKDAFYKRNMTAFSAIGAVALMSVVNFTVQAIPLWMLLLTYSASVLHNKEIAIKGQSIKMYVILSVMCFFSLWLSVGTYKNLIAQLNLKNASEYAKNKNYNRAIQILSKHSNYASTSESYFKILGELFLRQERYNDAISAFKQALKYSSSPRIYAGLAKSYLMVGERSKANECLVLINEMTPSKKH